MIIIRVCSFQRLIHFHQALSIFFMRKKYQKNCVYRYTRVPSRVLQSRDPDFFVQTYTCQLFDIYRRDTFYLKSAKIFRRGPIISEDVRRLPKMLRRVPSNTNTGIQRNIDFPTKEREFGESRSST